MRENEQIGAGQAAQSGGVAERLRALRARLEERAASDGDADAGPWRMRETRDYDERARDRRGRLAGLAGAAGFPALPFGMVAEGRDAWDEFIAGANDEIVYLVLGFVGGNANEYEPRMARERAEEEALRRLDPPMDADDGGYEDYMIWREEQFEDPAALAYQAYGRYLERLGRYDLLPPDYVPDVESDEEDEPEG